MSDKPRVEIREITPEWAAEVLRKHAESIEAGSFNQVDMNGRRILSYATDMKAGNWTLTGQGISFDVDGNLMDGQHRLAAIVKSGCTITMVVTWNLPKVTNKNINTIDLFDIGKKRTVGQQLKLSGFTNYFDAASAARCMLMLSQGNMKNNYTLPQQIAVANLMNNNICKLIEILAKNNTKGKHRGCIVAPLVVLHTSDRDSAELFATEYNEMTGLGKTSPVLQFARFMERTIYQQSGTDYQLRVMSALSSALFSYVNERKVEASLRGSQEHVNWLLKVSKNAVAKIREVAGVEMTVEELRAHEAN